MALQTARQNGFPVDLKALESQRRESDRRRARITGEMYELTGAINGGMGHGYQLLGQAALGTEPSDFTDAATFFLTGLQTAKGHWASLAHRPPQEDSDITATALALRGLRAYGEGAEVEAAISRGRSWLVNTPAISSEDRAMRLLGLVWARGDGAEISSARRQILEAQLPSGGWSQTPGRAADAYATGQALTALRASGVSPQNRAFTEGVRFLVGTQLADGSWRVSTRRVVSGLPHFETGYPHGIDQFISYAGASWATTALAVYAGEGNLASLTQFSTRPRKSVPARFSRRAADERLFKAIVRGTEHDVRRALRSGANPNAKTSFGTTALALAVRNSQKVGLLLGAGANPNRRTTLGMTPLAIASATRGALPTMRLLLDAKADPNLGRASNFDFPIVLAATVHEPERLDLLIDRGAHFRGGASLAIFYAAAMGDGEAMRRLHARGNRVNTIDQVFGGNVLTALATYRDLELAEIALELGADPSVPDAEGWSALQIAAAGDPDDSRMVERLLRAGAKLGYRSKTQPDALTLARNRRNLESIRLLEAASRTSSAATPMRRGSRG